jgi:hypothetical protein
MTATATKIARVRRMVNEPTSTTYSDAAIQALIEAHPLVDANGTSPTYYDPVTKTMIANTYWMATYDLNAAAADIMEEKGAVAAQDFDFNADGGNYTRNQVYEQYMKLARYYRARRSHKTMQMEPTPKADWAEEEDE